MTFLNVIPVNVCREPTKDTKVNFIHKKSLKENSLHKNKSSENFLITRFYFFFLNKKKNSSFFENTKARSKESRYKRRVLWQTKQLTFFSVLYSKCTRSIDKRRGVVYHIYDMSETKDGSLVSPFDYYVHL